MVFPFRWLHTMTVSTSFFFKEGEVKHFNILISIAKAFILVKMVCFDLHHSFLKGTWKPMLLIVCRNYQRDVLWGRINNMWTRNLNEKRIKSMIIINQLMIGSIFKKLCRNLIDALITKITLYHITFLYILE